MNDNPRVGSYMWRKERPKAYAVYNADYSPSGNVYERSSNPWAVETSDYRYERFPTHAEAFAFALEDSK